MSESLFKQQVRQPVFVVVLIAFCASWSLPAAERSHEKFQTAADYDALIREDHRKHWAFQPVRPPVVPVVKDMAWVRNPIDRFVLAGLEAKGWHPAPAAEPRALLRRMHLDLVGLPPSLAEQESFLRDTSPEAVSRRIDKLLTNPGYGERWGRYWLDLVRYADTNGYERDGEKHFVWRYRDYVIRSFNADKPYDQFILEQLAGDELPNRNAETLIAQGFYRLGPWDDEPADKDEDRADQLDDILATTSQTFLGLTLACARCHNHKFEPLTQLDYYRLTAVFNTLQRSQKNRSDRAEPVGTPEELESEKNRDQRNAERQQRIDAINNEFQKEYLRSGRCTLPDDAIVAFQTEPKNRSEAQRTLVSKRTPQLEKELAVALPKTTREQINHLEGEINEERKKFPDLPRAYFMHEPSPRVPVTHLLLRGRASRPGVVADPGIPAVMTTPGRPLEFPPPSERTTRRRLTFARWLASPENPLTARVIVNRVWQYHFGEGLVSTPSDFGVMGQSPSHPELLDWLADRFVADGWSLKKLHRLVMSSNTYRMSKKSNPEYAAKDPENLLLWRLPYRRLEVEPLRDSVLFVSGQLNRQMYGPCMYPYVPQAALAGSSDPDKIWKPYDERNASRRTIYAFVKRSLIVPFLEVFDLCDTTRSSPQRGVTCIAPQALTLFNGHFVNEQAGHFASRLEREAGSDARRQIQLAYRLALCREPTDREVSTMLAFLQSESTRGMSDAKQQTSKDSMTSRRLALVQLCRAIFNLNEFAYTD